MPSLDARVRIDRNLLLQIAKEIEPQAHAIGLETAEAIRQDAHDRAAKDTTSMALSLYVTDGAKSGYGEAVSAAESVNADVQILPEVRPEQPGEIIVAAAAAHAPTIEDGGDGKPARPFLTPAAEDARDGYTARMRRLAGG